jgi:hypothetical protein
MPLLPVNSSLSTSPLFSNQPQRHLLLALLLFVLCYVSFLSLFMQRSSLPRNLKGEFAEEFAIFWKPYDVTALKAAFSGPWIPAGTKESIRYFFRPIAILGYAGLYEMCGQDLTRLHTTLQYLSLFKFAAFFGIMYLLSNRSPWTAFWATFLYSTSFKIFDEQIVLHDFPDLLLAIFFFNSILLFLLFSRRRYSPAITALLGAFICLLFTLSLGTKENGLFLFPTFLAYRWISVWNKKDSFSENFKKIFQRKHLVLFTLLLFISCAYLAIRYYSLGAKYVFSPSWAVERRPAVIYSAINVANNFALVPESYVGHLFADDWLSTLIWLMFNPIIPIAGVYLCLRSDLKKTVKKSIVFSLVLVFLNTFFFTLGVRIRFNSIGNLGSFFLAVIVGQTLFLYALNKFRERYAVILTYMLLVGSVYYYTVLNVWNILHRPHPFYPKAPLEAGLFDWHKILDQNDDRGSAIVQLNLLNSHAATYDESARFSFFLLAVVLETDHRTLDCFDMSYRGLFRGSDAQVQLKRVENKAESIQQLKGYRQDFGLGLVSAADLLLKPKQAFQERRMDWSNGFDMQNFRNQFETARVHFKRSGPIGEGILNQLDEVAKRIDSSQDGKFSDQEIQAFLTAKLTSPEARE